MTRDAVPNAADVEGGLCLSYSAVRTGANVVGGRRLLAYNYMYNGYSQRGTASNAWKVTGNEIRSYIVTFDSQLGLPSHSPTRSPTPSKSPSKSVTPTKPPTPSAISEPVFDVTANELVSNDTSTEQAFNASTMRELLMSMKTCLLALLID